jgi:hypothetical protein
VPQIRGQDRFLPHRFWLIIHWCSHQSALYRVSQEERSIFWEIIISVIRRKKFIWTCVLFRAVSLIKLFECTVVKLLTRKRYYVLFLIFNVQVTNLLVYNTFSKILSSTSMQFATRVRTWRVARLSSSWRSFMREIASIMRSSSSSHVSTFLLYTSFFIQHHKQKSNGVKSGDLGGQLMVLPRPIHRLVGYNEEGLRHAEIT